MLSGVPDLVTAMLKLFVHVRVCVHARVWAYMHLSIPADPYREQKSVLNPLELDYMQL